MVHGQIRDQEEQREKVLQEAEQVRMEGFLVNITGVFLGFCQYLWLVFNGHTWLLNMENVFLDFSDLTIMN